MKVFTLFFCLLLSLVATASPINIKDFGAVGDGKTLDTKAINNAIEAATKGCGGMVYFPAGIYLSFSIHLASNISLYLDAGCILLAADSASAGNYGYDEAEPGPGNNYQDFGHSHWHNSLIWGENLHDVSILGPGIIDGKGLTRGTPRRPGVGNKAIALKLCRNVILKDFTILNGGHFGILATGVDNLTINNLKMDTNRDGMDIDCCQNVRISDCTINSPWDDAICLKSSMGLGFVRATENITITNCQVSGYDLGSFYDGTYRRNEWSRVPDKEGPTGRIKFGTESNGGFKNITISNCVFSYCRGLALETVDGALLEDVTITNITMRDVINAPLFLRLGSRKRGPLGTPVGALSRVIVSNVVAYNADAHFASIIRGINGNNIEDVQLNNINIYYRQIDSPATRIPTQIIEKDTIYPEPQKLGVMPAYGFVIRHAKGIELNNVQVHFLGKETRPAFWIEDANDITLYRIKAQSNGSEKANLVKRNVVSLKLEQCQGIKQ